MPAHTILQPCSRIEARDKHAKPKTTVNLLDALRASLEGTHKRPPGGISETANGRGRRVARRRADSRLAGGERAMGGEPLTPAQWERRRASQKRWEEKRREERRAWRDANRESGPHQAAET
jgi:hypothetical protein